MECNCDSVVSRLVPASCERFKPDWFWVLKQCEECEQTGYHIVTCHHTWTGLFLSTEPGTRNWCISVYRHVPIIAVLTDADVWNMYFNARVNTVYKILMDGIIITTQRTQKNMHGTQIYWSLAELIPWLHMFTTRVFLCLIFQEGWRRKQVIVLRRNPIHSKIFTLQALFIVHVVWYTELSFVVYISTKL